MSTPRDFEQFVAGFRAGQASDFAALMRACAVPSASLRGASLCSPTQAERDHFHKLLAAAMTDRPLARFSWRNGVDADVTGYLARESIRQSSFSRFL